MRRIVCYFSRLKMEDVENSTYKELVEKMSKLYGYQEFKTKSSLTLLEIHHQHSIFKEADRVLNISSGTAWAELIVKYTRSPANDPYVITVSQTQTLPTRGAHLIKGRLDQTETKVKLVEALKDNKFDLAVMNVLPPYSGFIEIDGFKLNGRIVDTLVFLDKFLKKGGGFVCKSIRTEETKELDKSFEGIFKEVYKYKVSFIRADSPMFYYIMKGFGMGKQSLLLNEFNQQYNKPHASKKYVIKKYQEKGLDAQSIAKRQLQNKIFKMLQQQTPEDQILRETSRQFFLQPQQIIQKFKEVETIQKTGTKKEAFSHIKRQFGQSFSSLPLDIPEDDIEGMQLFEKIHETYQPAKRQGRSKRLKSKSSQLLGRDQVYMQDNEDPLEFTNNTFYLERDADEDVAGQYQESIQDDIQKFKTMNPDFAEFYNKFQSGNYSFEQLSQYMGTSEFYDPKDDQIKAEIKKKTEESEVKTRRVRAQEMHRDANKYQVKGARSRPYMKNRNK